MINRFLARAPSAMRLWLAFLVLAPLIIYARFELRGPMPVGTPFAEVELPAEWRLPPGVIVQQHQ